MSKKIVWSPLSVNDFDNILEYLNNKWDKRVSNHFIDLTEDSIKQILKNPRQYPVIYKKEKIRKCVLTKHNSLFYTDSKTQIDILRIFDTRQNPRTITFK